MKRTLLPLAAIMALTLSACQPDDGTGPGPVPPQETTPPVETIPPPDGPTPIDPALPPPIDPAAPPPVEPIEDPDTPTD